MLRDSMVSKFHIHKFWMFCVERNDRIGNIIDKYVGNIAIEKITGKSNLHNILHTHSFWHFNKDISNRSLSVLK